MIDGGRAALERELMWAAALGRPTLESLSVPLRHSVFGRALARVMAHEIYHILAHTTEHAIAEVILEKV